MPETDIGDLRWQVTLATRAQNPDPYSTGIVDTYENPIQVFADIRPVGTAVYIAGQQLELAQQITHRITLRYRDGIDLFDVVLRETTRPDGSQRFDRYAIRRTAEWQGRRRWTILDVQIEESV